MANCCGVEWVRHEEDGDNWCFMSAFIHMNCFRHIPLIYHFVYSLVYWSLCSPFTANGSINLASQLQSNMSEISVEAWWDMMRMNVSVCTMPGKWLQNTVGRRNMIVFWSNTPSICSSTHCKSNGISQSGKCAYTCHTQFTAVDTICKGQWCPMASLLLPIPSCTLGPRL